MIFGLFRGRGNAPLIERLHGELVAAARAPVLFTDYGIADDLDGRFESLALHGALMLRRLRQLPPPGPDIAQDLTDAIFHHFDAGLREMGVSDIAVPKRMRALAEAFLGRAAAYHAALGEGPEALRAALSRNVFGGRADSLRLARYTAGIDAAFAGMTLEQFLKGPIFPVEAATVSEVPR